MNAFLESDLDKTTTAYKAHIDLSAQPLALPSQCPTTGSRYCLWRPILKVVSHARSTGAVAEILTRSIALTNFEHICATFTTKSEGLRKAVELDCG